MEPIKILVVDDEQRMRKLVKDFLQKNGWTSFLATEQMTTNICT